jgi:hypothetical protein
MSIQKEVFKQLVINKMRPMTKIQRNLKRFKPNIPLYPWAYEKTFKDIAMRLVYQPLLDILKAKVTEENFNNWVKEYSRHDSLHLDDYPDEINRIIGTLSAVEDTDAKGDLSHLAVGIYNHTKGDWKKQTEKVTGVPFSTDESWWEKTRRAWIQENDGYLKAYPDELVKKINTTIYEGVRG